MTDKARFHIFILLEGASYHIAGSMVLLSCCYVRADIQPVFEKVIEMSGVIDLKAGELAPTWVDYRSPLLSGQFTITADRTPECSARGCF